MARKTYCPRCKDSTVVPANFHYFCGTPLVEVKGIMCSICLNESGLYDKFCTECGHSMKEALERWKEDKERGIIEKEAA